MSSLENNDWRPDDFIDKKDSNHYEVEVANSLSRKISYVNN